MPLTRRQMLAVAAGGITSGLAHRDRARARRLPTALLFDAFAVFDPRPVAARAERMFPGKGAELGALWRTRQFEYSWLRSIGRRYEDFWTVTEAALDAAARALGIDIRPEQRARLMRGYLELTAYPDVPAALVALRASGVRLALLSNLTQAMLEAAIRNAGLEGVFERTLSTDRVRTYKPDPRTYALGCEALRLEREDVAYAAFAGWDVAGATWFGYRTFWINRSGQPAEELGVSPDATFGAVADLAASITAR